MLRSVRLRIYVYAHLNVRYIDLFCLSGRLAAVSKIFFRKTEHHLSVEHLGFRSDNVTNRWQTSPLIDKRFYV